MSCEKIMGLVHEREARDVSFWIRLRVGLHLFACLDCAKKAARLDLCRQAMREDFFPPSAGLEDAVMAALAKEEGALAAEEAAEPGGFSLGTWVVAGLVLLVSLPTIFFGMGFYSIVRAAGVSLMIPIGITMGIALTVYGTLFIGSHLKRLSERFGLES